MTTRRRRPLLDPVRADHDAQRVMVVLPREVVSAARARAWIAAFLDAHGVPEARRRDAVLVVSELVTNALRYGLGEVVARASIEHRDEIHLAVTDSGDELPVVLPADPERVGGIGLRVVDQLSAEWGVTPFPGGKTVWATLTCVVRA